MTGRHLCWLQIGNLFWSVIIPLMFRGRCKPSCEAVRQILTMWGEVPPGVWSFHPPSPSSSFFPRLFSVLFLFFILYERQSLLPNTETPQELIIQKTRPGGEGEERTAGGREGGWRAGRGKESPRVKVGRGCSEVCAHSFYIVNDLRVYQSHGAFCTSHKPSSFDSLPAIFPNTAFCGLCQTYLRNYLLIIY